jgi:long-chain acyl-CoA synthetase
MEIKRVFDILENFRVNFPGKPALGFKYDKDWKTFSTEEYVNYSNLVSYALLSLNFEKGDKIATITANRPEWNFFDMGILQVGMVHVPIYTTLSESDYDYVLRHSDAKMLIIGDNALYKKLLPIVEKIPQIEYIYTISEIEGTKNWMQLVELGKVNQEKLATKLQEIKTSVAETDLASIIYTSGTTGLSKGVMLSHQNLASNAVSAANRQHLNEKHKALSFLPLSHVYERIANYQFQIKGLLIYYAENVGKVAVNVNELQVDGFATVPRLLEAVYDKIMQKANNLTGVKKSIFFWALNLAENFNPDGNNSAVYRAKLKIADKLVFTKWRDALSQNLSFIGSGGSALVERLARIFWAAGMPVFEGYGLTETSPIIAVNYWKNGAMRLGTVGTLMENVEVKIADDGEILSKGPNLMLGYYKDDEKTREVIDQDGWFHTGDIGRLEEGKYLRITDRKKEIFKMSNGKYIAPQAIENLFKQSQFINQIMIVGENEKFASAIISPNFEVLKNWAQKNKISFQDIKELIENNTVLDAIQQEIKKLNTKLATFEQIKKFKLVPDEWTPFSGELSPTLKLKRKVIVDKYKSLIDSIYQKFSNKSDEKSQLQED